MGGRKMGLWEGTERTELWQKDDWQKNGEGNRGNQGTVVFSRRAVVKIARCFKSDTNYADFHEWEFILAAGSSVNRRRLVAPMQLIS